MSIGPLASNTHLADDFVHWMGLAWDYVHNANDREPREILEVNRQALGWLCFRREPGLLLEVRRHWWRRLDGIRQRILSQGDGSDVAALFEMLSHSELLDLPAPEEVLALAREVLNRIEALLQASSLSLAPNENGKTGAHAWRRCLREVIETIRALFRDDCLNTALVREEADDLLTRLVSNPFSDARAKPVLRLLSS
jgi:hypothetical protein